MDVLAVQEVTRFCRDFVLKNGPIVIDCATYRYHGHSMSDPGTRFVLDLTDLSSTLFCVSSFVWFTLYGYILLYFILICLSCLPFHTSASFSSFCLPYTCWPDLYYPVYAILSIVWHPNLLSTLHSTIIHGIFSYSFFFYTQIQYCNLIGCQPILSRI